MTLRLPFKQTRKNKEKKAMYAYIHHDVHIQYAARTIKHNMTILVSSCIACRQQGSFLHVLIPGSQNLLRNLSLLCLVKLLSHHSNYSTCVRSIGMVSFSRWE
jgi:hypothetical protein